MQHDCQQLLSNRRGAQGLHVNIQRAQERPESVDHRLTDLGLVEAVHHALYVLTVIPVENSQA